MAVSEIPLEISNFYIVTALLGGFLSLFGLVSYLLKERFYLSEALIATLFGLTFSPHAANLIKPLEYANYKQADLDEITHYFCHLVLGVQLVLAGIQLPSRYLRKEWRSLALLLGPGMCVMWVSTSLLVWAMVPHFGILQALAVGACVTPTDPVLSNSIVKGKFAEKYIPKELRRIVIAESGANDGLGYPFLFLAMYLLHYTGEGEHSAGKAIGYWFGITWGYEIIMSVLYGALVGWIFKEALHWAEEKKYVDRESFLVFAITLALFIIGTLGMLGGDDVLACFIAGNSFTWDDWFRLETEDDSLQPTVDMLLNVAIFAYFGAVCPWPLFAHSPVIPVWRLIILGILILLFRRIPIVYTLHHWIYQIEQKRQALFVGFFGPIGVSAVFYIHVASVYLKGVLAPDGTQREDAKELIDTIEVIVWFMVMCSILVHGLSIPIAKLFLQIPRALSRAQSDSQDAQPFSTFQPETSQASKDTEIKDRRKRKEKSKKQGKKCNKEDISGPQAMHKIGRPIQDEPSSEERDAGEKLNGGDGGQKSSERERGLTGNEKIELEREGHVAPIRS